MAGFSALLGAALYLGYGVGRVVSTLVDGSPGGSLLGAMAVELLLGLACVSAVRAGGDQAPAPAAGRAGAWTSGAAG
jgi:hypothetical protein